MTEQRERFKVGRRNVQPSTPRERRHPCMKANGGGKKPWPSKAAAEAVARYGDHARPVEVYRCIGCGYWHIGHLNPNPRADYNRTMPERHPELLAELGVRAVAVLTAENHGDGQVRRRWIRLHAKKLARATAPPASVQHEEDT